MSSDHAGEGVWNCWLLTHEGSVLDLFLEILQFLFLFSPCMHIGTPTTHTHLDRKPSTLRTNPLKDTDPCAIQTLTGH